jgi:hypothetical protein
MVQSLTLKVITFAVLESVVYNDNRKNDSIKVNIIEHHDQVKGLQNKELHIIRK